MNISTNKIFSYLPYIVIGAFLIIVFIMILNEQNNITNLKTQITTLSEANSETGYKLDQVASRLTVVDGQYLIKGDQGDTGMKGDAGETGAQGVKGDRGDKGDIGPQGVKGDRGDKGDSGVQGPKGDTGLSGLEKRCSGAQFIAAKQLGASTAYCASGKKVLSAFGYVSGGSSDLTVLEQINYLGCNSKDLSAEQPGMQCFWVNNSSQQLQITTCVTCAYTN
jgi:hypothetical protein